MFAIMTTRAHPKIRSAATRSAAAAASAAPASSPFSAACASAPCSRTGSVPCVGRPARPAGTPGAACTADRWPASPTRSTDSRSVDWTPVQQYSNMSSTRSALTNFTFSPRWSSRTSKFVRLKSPWFSTLKPSALAVKISRPRASNCGNRAANFCAYTSQPDHVCKSATKCAKLSDMKRSRSPPLKMPLLVGRL